jgi:hypothetical protein
MEVVMKSKTFNMSPLHGFPNVDKSGTAKVTIGDDALIIEGGLFSQKTHVEIKYSQISFSRVVAHDLKGKERVFLCLKNNEENTQIIILQNLASFDKSVESLYDVLASLDLPSLMTDDIFSLLEQYSYFERPLEKSEVKKIKNDIATGKAQKKAKDALDKYGLDFSSYDMKHLRALNARDCQQISASLAGSSLYSFGSLFGGNANQSFSMEMARAQVYQNWILMRQNEEIIRLLKTFTEEQSQQ